MDDDLIGDVRAAGLAAAIDSGRTVVVRNSRGVFAKSASSWPFDPRAVDRLIEHGQASWVDGRLVLSSNNTAWRLSVALRLP